MNANRIFRLIELILAIGIFSATNLAAQQYGAVQINGRPMTPQQVQEYTQAYGSPPFPGSYWYDTKTGMYGLMGGPAVGIIKPGHNFGEMPENASSGNSGVYINGRHLPLAELQAYAPLLGQIEPGRYWMDAQGNWGPEGQAQPSTGSRAAQNPAPQSQGNGGGGDPRLVGVFKGENVSGGDGVIFNTQFIWAFQADGTVYYGAQSHYDVSIKHYDGNEKWGASGQTGKGGERGRWSTSGKLLTIQWESGDVSRFAYGFEPNGSLVYRNPRTGKLINFFPRIK